MRLSTFLVAPLLLASVGLAVAQPQPVQQHKEETTDELIARFDKQRKARIIKDFQDHLRKQFKLSDDDINSVQLFIARRDTELQIVRKALYQVTLAEDDTDLSDADYAVFWSDFQTLLAKYRTQKEQDAAKLSEQLHLDQNLHLKSFLTIRGILGDDLVESTPMSETFMNSDMLGYHLEKELGENKPRRVVVPDEKPNG